MATLSLTQSAWNNASPFQRRVLKLVGEAVDLGQPAKFTGEGKAWLVFDYARFTLLHAAAIGAVVTKLSQMSSSQQEQLNQRSDRELRQGIKEFLKDKTIRPRDIQYSEDGDVWQETLDAQSTPSAVRMSQGVPVGWQPVVEDTN